ncbi:hypothetical protein [Candidatus Frankia alpina]|uniref:hypothetical protein n=1 Tax=Candidatus Frankia alpina TaxID=2699483 RepID=UPI001386BDB6|nr:hypothetical protein [Candidatus Frankia alpina]
MSRFARVRWLTCSRCRASYTSEQGHRCPRDRRPARVVRPQSTSTPPQGRADGASGR